jgi:hypothetical protein
MFSPRGGAPRTLIRGDISSAAQWEANKWALEAKHTGFFNQKYRISPIEPVLPYMLVYMYWIKVH